MSKIELCDISSCTQCHACESVCPKNCITFKMAKGGFYVPDIDRELCVKCGACMKACHQVNPSKTKQAPLKTYAAWSLVSEVRTSSSSGGVFSEIARYIFERKGIVVGAVMNEHLKVCHSFASNMKELYAMRGSKYVQSELTGVYIKVKDLLKDGRYVLFTGTPCQVGGLYAFLKMDYDNLLTCDLICHGVPSQKSFDTYCEKTGLKNKVAEVSFRYTKGWGYQMALRSHLVSPSRDGDYKWKNISPKKSYYLRAFTDGLMFNEACYNCQYATPERVSDITMADYWGIGTEKPFNHPISKGVSLVLVNTEKGQTVISECKKLYTEERTISEAVTGNYNLSHCSERPKGRDSYCLDAQELKISQLCKKYGLLPDIKDYLRPLKRFVERYMH